MSNPRPLLSNLATRLYAIWNNLLSIGVQKDMPFIEVRRTKLMNLLALPGIPFISYFVVLNLSQQRYLLAGINFLSLLGNLSVLFLHINHQNISARFFVIIYSTVLYTFSGMYFQNGAEYFLLNILVITLLVYDNNWIRWGFSLTIICCFVMIHFMPQQLSFAPAVPRGRAIVNVSMSLGFIILALTYFKRIHSDYLSVIDQQRKSLVLMNSDKEKLFSIVAHDIRSPLTSLESALYLLRDGDYSQAEMKEVAHLVRKKVAHLSETVDNLLRWSASQMKGIRAQPVQFDLRPLIQSVLELLDPIIREKGIRVETRFGTAAPIFADPDQAMIIVRNLINNALKFSHPGGKISISTSNSENGVRVEISDEGIGMTPSQLENLFTPRSEPHYDTSGELGTGVGLLISKQFTDQNSGCLYAQSIPSKGSTFVLELPTASQD